MTDPLAHGKARAGLITGTCAHTIMHGSMKGWRGLSRQLWADDGSTFRVATSGPRAHGHAQEKVGLALAWEEVTSKVVEPAEFTRCYTGNRKLNRIRHYLGVSPDGWVLTDQSKRIGSERIAGVEVKSPVHEHVYQMYADEIDAGKLPQEHECQVRHGSLVTGLPWLFVVHHQGKLKHLWVDRDLNWEADYIRCLRAFVRFYLEGREPTKKKASSLLERL